MKKLFIFIITTVLLGACITTNSKNETTATAKPKPTYRKYNIPNSTNKAIEGLEGCTKEFAFNVMGIPTREKIIDGKKYFEWSIRNASCIVDANVNDEGIIENIYYQDTRNECEHMYLRIVNYYRKNPAQSEQTCPNRTDLQGNHYNK
ncbi:MAG: hypothetical protein J6Y25_01580 [Elusimicrobiaceae bacterium]|nr:hypothetical protein [Elusimicrobiaceae bacterium]